MPELIPAEPLSPEWHAARRRGVTATDIVTILGLSSWDSVYSLFWRKMGQVPEVPDNDRFRLGRELESYIILRWQEECPGLVATGTGRTWRHSERSWQMATPDRHVWDSPQALNDMTAHPDGVLECKTWADADRHSWGQGLSMLGSGEGAAAADPRGNARQVAGAGLGQPAPAAIPPAVRAQVLWQMDVMDVAMGHVGVVFLPSGEFRSYIIEHDPPAHGPALLDDDDSVGCAVCTDLKLMRAAGEEFMARLRLELPPPDPDASAATLAAVRARFTRQPDKQAEINDTLWALYDQACHKISYWTEEKRGHEIQIREQTGEASVLTVNGEPVARRVISDAQVKAHVRHQDYLRRIKQGNNDER